MNEALKRAAARAFSERWAERGDEKQETQQFWTELLRTVYGSENPEQVIEFEVPVKLSHTSYIDAYIPETRVLIEQKSADVSLTKGSRQSDGQMLTPYGQARRYAAFLPYNKAPRWIVVCNFKVFEIHDMNFPNADPETVLLKDLETDYHRLQFLVDTGNEATKKEMEVSLQAGELVGLLYDALLKQYADPESDETLKSLNALCVRIVFCLYAEDAGVFGRRNMFHDYLKDVPATGIRKALVELFRVLDQRPEERDKYLSDDNPALAAFPYVNGGLFADENIEIPPFTEELKNILLSNASEDFDWSAISPTIFGAVFESTLNPETRRSGGMHYTSIENIHKVIDPLFLDGLKAELEEIKEIAVEKTRISRLKAYQRKLAGLTFLDPACGSGNFLTESYISLRRLENDALRCQTDQITMGDYANPIQVSIHQFYGIEINDFAATVAKTALWIAESQMLKETEDIIAHQIDFLPLKSYANITEGNALRLNWEDVVPKAKLNYIMGNPPFVGYTYQSAKQKADLQATMSNIGKNIDYVSGWYFKTAQYIQNTGIRAAFVSTNSITQGEQVAGVWKPLYDRFGIHIDFAYRTFRWDSEASLKAHVHCVIVGFSVQDNPCEKLLFTSERVQYVQNISPYLIDAPTLFIENRSKPICLVPEICKGSQPTDGGNLIITESEYNDFIRREPGSIKYIRLFLGADEFLNGKKRYCLWLVGASPKELQAMPLVLERVQKVRDFRQSSKKAATRKQADAPTLFTENRQPLENFIAIPEVSSGARRYIPMGFLNSDIVCSNKLQLLPSASIYHFGVLMSNVHMAWMRSVCGRLKSDYDYSAKIVYNNFPWPTPTDEQRAKIEQTAQAILDARALYPDCSLAEMYGTKMYLFPELIKAHQQNDRAVMRAYGFDIKTTTESSCVAELMKMYQNMTQTA